METFEVAVECPYCKGKATCEGSAYGVEGRCGCGAEFWGRFTDRMVLRIRWRPKTSIGATETPAAGR